MLPRRISGTCAKHQRKLRVAIMRARVLALLPYWLTDVRQSQRHGGTETQIGKRGDPASECTDVASSVFVRLCVSVLCD